MYKFKWCSWFGLSYYGESQEKYVVMIIAAKSMEDYTVQSRLHFRSLLFAVLFLANGASHSSSALCRLNDVVVTQLSYPHLLSMPPVPPCLTIQFYSSNQLLFPVIVPISSSPIHLLMSFTASFTTDPSAPILIR